MTPLIIDRRPSYLSGADAPASLLSLPLGQGTVLSHLLEAIGHRADLRALVIPGFSIDENYRRTIADCVPCEIKVLSAEELGSERSAWETSDYFLVVDPARWPYAGFDLPEAIGSIQEYRGATHAIAVGRESDNAREHVEFDTKGQIRRVQRLYNGVNWPEVASSSGFLSVVPACTMTDTHFRSLGELRSALASRGVLSRDMPLPVDALDLTAEEGFLALHERRMLSAVAQDGEPGYVKRGPQVLVGKNCRIHPSVRLVGPTIIQDGVQIEAGARVIGPSVIGAGCVLRVNSVVAQSVLAAGTDVAAETCIRHQVLAGQCNARTVGSAAPHIELSTTGPGDVRIAGRPGPDVAGVPRSRKAQLAVKRAIDIVVSLVGLVFMSPVLLLVALIIKLESKGPILFVHHREKKGESEFPCLKFRTMVANAHEQQRQMYKDNEIDGPQFKIRCDPRITRFGRWLRATNLDEVPQLINVLLGHMSLVGPRPSPFRENQICVPWRRARLSVRPGITGLWQICRGDDRSMGDFHEWIFYDLAYVREFSLWLDLRILWATLTSLGGRWSVPLRRLIPNPRQLHGRARRPAAA